MGKEAVSPRRVCDLLGRFPGKCILVVGDLMDDHFIRGRVGRLSPEAPVPVVAVGEETHLPGGAGNVCCNLASLGARVRVFGAVGPDPAGERLLCDLRGRGVDPSGVAVEKGRQTTQKVRVIAEHQQVVRFDREGPGHLLASSLERIGSSVEAAARDADAVVISDYGKGVVVPLLLRRILRAARMRSIPVVVDPKIEHFRRYVGVDCITPNTHEAWAGMGVLPRPGEEPLAALGRKIMAALRVRMLLITRGEKGMSLFEDRGRSIRHIPAQAKEVFDVTGAGDTVTSIMALALSSGAEPLEAAVIANAGAGVVVGKLGTATLSPAELRSAALEAVR
jgi:D-beta-D-heptose 7-phosphate kinase/D-beta-D-heptose 1-phosphate adenosyltransferase